MTMLERVAKASNRYYVRMWRRLDHFAIFDGEKEWDSEPVSDIERSEGETRDACRLMSARAAIEAMMEPTEEMISVGDNALEWGSSDESGGWFVSYNEGDAKKSYQAMLRAILNEAPETQNPRHPDKDGETK